MFVVRTIRHGRVKIGGKWYWPDQRHLAYDGRLDELRYAFARYRGHYPGGPWLPFVQLWGTEGQFRGWTPIEEYGPELVDGCFPWMHWALAPGQEGT